MSTVPHITPATARRASLLRDGIRRHCAIRALSSIDTSACIAAATSALLRGASAAAAYGAGLRRARTCAPIAAHGGAK